MRQKIFFTPNQSAVLIIVPKLPGSDIPSNAIKVLEFGKQSKCESSFEMTAKTFDGLLNNLFETFLDL